MLDSIRQTGRVLTVCAFIFAAPAAFANQAEEAAPPAPALETPPPAEVPPPEVSPAPDVAPATTPAVGPGATDHDSIVRHWGIEARRLGTLQRTLGQDPACTPTNCPVDMNAFSVRRWASRSYAYSFGLALAAGGGSTRQNGDTATWDTYFGVGPTVGANFLLANFQHLAVSFSPQLDTVFFLPASSAPKTIAFNLRGLFEGELHLGFWGIPQLSVGIASGLDASFRYVTKGETGNPGGVATQWSVTTTGPQSLWGIVTNMFVRFYL